jgi:hypothetical protein
LQPDAAVIAATRDWVRRTVIGLNLCPFAKAVEQQGQVRYVVSHARREEDLLADLRHELAHLAATPAELTDDTLLIHPDVLQEFFEFQQFLARADAAVRKIGLEGVIQIASFHPDYQFADTEPDDVTNCTNRAPYPTLHLLREASIAEAVKSNAAAAGIYERNQATMRALGKAGWEKLKLGEQPTGLASSATEPNP